MSELCFVTRECRPRAANAKRIRFKIKASAKQQSKNAVELQQFEIAFKIN